MQLEESVLDFAGQLDLNGQADYVGYADVASDEVGAAAVEFVVVAVVVELTFDLVSS